ncbi:TetR/AcrR family transcriptional regulator [Brevibacillus fluminis]
MDTHNTHTNNDKMLLAAIDLMAEKGYKGVSTKEIAAAAGVSEMTLFRHFGSKQNLLETAVDRFYYTVEMKQLFKDRIVWDLHTDLLLVSQTYHEIMYRNRKLILIIQKESGNLPGFREKTHKHPRQLQEMLTEYFKAMQAKGKMIPTDPTTHAIAFLWLNHGAFMGYLNGSALEAPVPLEQFIETSVQLFTRALTP